MSPETRSRVMARIRGKDTGPELLIARALAARGLEWESHARDLPGRPDFVFRPLKLALFIDGDFWHGWKFDEWRHKLSEKWERKIEAEELEIGDLKIENRLDRITVYGRIDLTRDKVGLESARVLKQFLDDVVTALERDPALPERVAASKAPVMKKNPFA